MNHARIYERKESPEGKLFSLLSVAISKKSYIFAETLRKGQMTAQRITGIPVRDSEYGSEVNVFFSEVRDHYWLI